MAYDYDDTPPSFAVQKCFFDFVFLTNNKRRLKSATHVQVIESPEIVGIVKPNQINLSEKN